MIDLLRDAVHHTIPMIPVLFVLYAGLEVIARQNGVRLARLARRAEGIGPLLGAALGVVPQCGISVFMTSLFLAGRVSRGTLVSTYLATSDEALPVLIAHGGQGGLILKIVGIKVVLGSVAGLLVDALAGRRAMLATGALREEPAEPPPLTMAAFAHVLRHALARTLTIFAWVLSVTVLLGAGVAWLGGDAALATLRQWPVLEVFGAALFGLIPNCAASIAIAEAAVREVLPLPATIAGLAAGAGYGPILLLKDGRLSQAVHLLLTCLLISCAAGLAIMLVVPR